MHASCQGTVCQKIVLPGRAGSDSLICSPCLASLSLPGCNGIIISVYQQTCRVRCRLVQVLHRERLIVASVGQTCYGKPGMMREEPLVCCHDVCKMIQTRSNRLQRETFLSRAIRVVGTTNQARYIADILLMHSKEERASLRSKKGLRTNAHKAQMVLSIVCLHEHAVLTTLI